MLTPEQTRLRLYDNEVRKLREENAAMKKRFSELRVLVPALLRELQKRVPLSDAMQIQKLISELDDA